MTAKRMWKRCGFTKPSCYYWTGEHPRREVRARTVHHTGEILGWTIWIETKGGMDLKELPNSYNRTKRKAQEEAETLTMADRL